MKLTSAVAFQIDFIVNAKQFCHAACSHAVCKGTYEVIVKYPTFADISIQML